MTEHQIGQRVIVNGEADGEEFTNERGVIAKNPSYLSNHVTVRFDRHREEFHDGLDGDDGHHWFFNLSEGGYSITPEHRSTYLNGLERPRCGACDRPPEDQCDLCKSFSEPKEEEPAKPRFMTAWMTDDAQPFYPTGDAFKSLEDAQAFAVTKLAEGGEEDQIAIFEIRSVHMARLVVLSEAA